MHPRSPAARRRPRPRLDLRSTEPLEPRTLLTLAWPALPSLGAAIPAEVGRLAAQGLASAASIASQTATPPPIVGSLPSAVGQQTTPSLASLKSFSQAGTAATLDSTNPLASAPSLAGRTGPTLPSLSIAPSPTPAPSTTSSPIDVAIPSDRLEPDSPGLNTPAPHPADFESLIPTDRELQPEASHAAPPALTSLKITPAASTRDRAPGTRIGDPSVSAQEAEAPLPTPTSSADALSFEAPPEASNPEPASLIPADLTELAHALGRWLDRLGEQDLGLPASLSARDLLLVAALAVVAISIRQRARKAADQTRGDDADDSRFAGFWAPGLPGPLFLGDA